MNYIALDSVDEYVKKIKVSGSNHCSKDGSRRVGWWALAIDK